MGSEADTIRRLDVFLVENGYFDSRARAQAAIRAGRIRVDGVVAEKPSAPVSRDSAVIADRPDHEYVSRGGIKLAAALEKFQIDPRDRVCLDLGASTGGFTEVLLRRDARKVFAVDVGVGQLHPTLRDDPRVINLEKTHAKSLTRDLVPEAIDIIVVDVSFISLKKVLAFAWRLAGAEASLAALVKPQFEVGPENIGKGGLVKPGRKNAEGVVEAIGDWLESEGRWRVNGWIESPITGGDGNREFLLGATTLQ